MPRTLRRASRPFSLTGGRWNPTGRLCSAAATVEPMPTDVLAQIAALPNVSDYARSARDAIDALLWDRQARKVFGPLAKESALRGAWASAAMDGAEIPYDSITAGDIEDSPMGQQVQRAVAMTVELPSLVDIYARSPLQAWARMNTMLASGLAPESEVGRPRSDSEVDDPLRIGQVPLAMDCADRLTALASLIVTPTEAPAIVQAAVIHGELATLRPFRHGSGLIARATIRLALAAPGLDPDLLTVPESGLFTMGRSKYVHGIRAYASGTAEGMTDWVQWFSTAIVAGAQTAQGMAASIKQ